MGVKSTLAIVFAFAFVCILNAVSLSHEEITALVNKRFELMNNLDYEGYSDTIDDDTEVTTPPFPPVKGKAAKANMKLLFSMLDSWVVTRTSDLYFYEKDSVAFRLSSVAFAKDDKCDAVADCHTRITFKNKQGKLKSLFSICHRSHADISHIMNCKEPPFDPVTFLETQLTVSRLTKVQDDLVRYGLNETIYRKLLADDIIDYHPMAGLIHGFDKLMDFVKTALSQFKHTAPVLHDFIVDGQHTSFFEDLTVITESNCRARVSALVFCKWENSKVAELRQFLAPAGLKQMEQCVVPIQTEL